MKRILVVLALVVSGTVIAAPNAAAAEMAVNGGFETGSLAPWSCSGNLGSVVSSPAHSGSHALQAAASSSNNAKCSQTVSGLVSGTSYTVSGWFQGSYTFLGVTGGSSTWRSGSSWGKLSLNFTASGTSAEIYFHGWYGQGTYHADDLSVQGEGGGGDTTPPSVPGNLRVTGTTSSSISLAWNASSDNVGVTGYDVYRGSSLVTTVSGTSYTDTGLAANTSYTYTVRARDAAGNASGNSNSATGTTTGGGGDTQPPTAPGNLRAIAISTSSVSLAWNASTDNVGVVGYQVYRGSTMIITVGSTTYTDNGRAPCTSYTYTVRAIDGAGNLSAPSNALTVTTPGCTVGGGMAAPYLYLGWGNPPSATSVMSATGIKQFTMAFMLSGGGCVPRWDSQRPLLGGQDQQVINQIRAAGGDIEISFGGWSGNKLGPNCSTAQALAGAYQQVIDAYDLKYVDIDIENTDEFESAIVQDRILNALKIVKQNNPGIKTILTFPTLGSGPNYWGNRLIDQSVALQANIDNFTIMPFNFGCSGSMYACTVTATEGLKNKLKSAYGWSDAQAYAHIGISGMNGRSDQGEITTVQNWTDITNWAKSNGLARLAFWSVNRDRAGGGSGTPQGEFEFTRITAQFN